ncbi:uncharacterized protein JCM15063_001931 [Sporobolomyces koalae]|uniref:uncharacterized protein n=1 Tax=Sporobolomyces koalae TaxID=500713 RepID=UPI00316E31E7
MEQDLKVETRSQVEDLSHVPQPSQPELEGSQDPAPTVKEDERERDPVQLPTPSPSSNSTSTFSSSTKPASPAVPTHSKLKRSRSRISSRGQPQASEESDVDGKRYLTCGMYFSPGITAPNPSLLRRKNSTAARGPRKSSSSFSWRTITPSRETILPPPIHYGLMLLGEAPETYHKLDEDVQETDDSGSETDDDENDDEPGCGFNLPFDILRDFYYADDAIVTGKGGQCDEPAAEVEKREQSRKPQHYRNIQRNYYVDRKPDRIDVAAVCSCSRPSDPSQPGCLENCINRMMQYCCDPKICPCGDQCSNIPLNKRTTIKEGKDGLQVIWTGNRGFGLKTMVPIRKGELVIEYRGEIISRDESYRRVLNDYKDRSDYYFLEYDTFEVIDAGLRGNSARFINHSCGPNCEVVRWRLANIDEYQVGIFAKRDIHKGEELTYNYGWQNFVDLADANGSTRKGMKSTDAAPTVAGVEAEIATNDIARQRCFCGSALCSGFLGGKPKEDVSGRLFEKSKGKRQAKGTQTVPEVITSAKKDKTKPIKLDWAPPQPKSSRSRSVTETDDCELAPPPKTKRKLLERVSELVRATSLRGAAAKAKAKLTGQR